nr:NAD-dependent succinate-semialdehyde dehydrogenase [Rhodococcus opacus]
MTIAVSPSPDTRTTAELRGHLVTRTLFIDGRWVDTDSTFDVVDPATGEVIGSVADGRSEHAAAALDAASAAQADWAAVSPRARAELLHSAHDVMKSHADAFIDVLTLESGKPRTESAGEFHLSTQFLRWFAEQAAHVHGSYSPASAGDFRIITRQDPIGPSLLITPWNFPLLMPARKISAALAAGCTTVVKSAGLTPFTAALMTQVFAEAGFPPGVVNLIHTTTSGEVSSALMADPRLRKVSFTGSTGAGRVLLGQAAQNIMGTSMELGGNGPFLVLDDADVDAAVEHAIVCKFRNAGQACVAANRIILQSGIADEFTAKFVAATRALVVGNGFTDGVDVGPMISEKQRAEVHADVTDAVAGGAELLTGGAVVDGPGYFYEPTVLRFSGTTHPLACKELFAPAATLFTVDTVDEAVAFANDTDMGLAAYVFTRDLSLAMTVAERLESGMVGVNRGVMSDPAAPFGGIKNSGLGREGGHDALHEFLETKYIALTV